jgi:hypothetical protein
MVNRSDIYLSIVFESGLILNLALNSAKLFFFLKKKSIKKQSFLFFLFFHFSSFHNYVKKNQSTHLTPPEIKNVREMHFACLMHMYLVYQMEGIENWRIQQYAQHTNLFRLGDFWKEKERKKKENEYYYLCMYIQSIVILDYLLVDMIGCKIAMIITTCLVAAFFFVWRARVNHQVGPEPFAKVNLLILVE